MPRGFMGVKKEENVIKNGMYISKCTCHLLLELFVNFLPAGYHF